MSRTGAWDLLRVWRPSRRDLQVPPVGQAAVTRERPHWSLPAWHFMVFAYSSDLTLLIKAHRGDADSCWSGHSSPLFKFLHEAQFQ